MAVVDVGPVLAGSDLPIPFMATNGTTPVNNAKSVRRNLLAALLAPGAAEQTVRDGVLPRLYGTGAAGLTYTSLSLIQSATPAQNVIAFPGTAVISRSGQGPYLLMQTTVPVIPLSVADGTNPRYDVIYIRLYDAKLGDATFHGFQWCRIEGNPAASPVIPSLPAVDGVIPIGAILRPAGVNTVANSQIVDLRKGTALYGGTRVLLPGDLLTDAGSYHGERRSRITSSSLTALGAPPVLYDWWDAVNTRWRGTQRISIDVRGTSGTITDGGTRQCASLVIPDPGWRYRVTAGGTARLSSVPAGATEAGAAMQHRVGVSTFATAYTNDLCGTSTLHARSSGGNAYMQAPMKTSAIDFAGSQTVYKLIQNNTGATVSYAGETETYDSFTVVLEPA